MRKTSIAENWSAVEELRMVISRVGEERRTLEAQLGKVIKGIRDAGSTADFRILFEIFEILEIFEV